MIIENVRIVLEDRVIPNGSVHIKDGKITEIKEEKGEGVLTLAPGVIDLHTHGSGGFDFMDGDASSIWGAGNSLAKGGTTTCLPTTLTCQDDVLFSFFDAFRSYKDNKPRNACHMPGLHLEGPFFSSKRKGAQPESAISNPTKERYIPILKAGEGIIKRWSVAPELDGAMDFISDISSRGIVVSAGHTDATIDIIGEAIKHGLKMLTHYGNAMSTIVSINSWKTLGVLEAGLYFDDLYLEVISDGCHIPPEYLKYIFKLKDNSHILGISDSMRGAMLEEGTESTLGQLDTGVPVIIEDGVAKLMDCSAFAGSVATGIRMIKTLREQAELPLPNVFRALSLIPATLIGEDKNTGSISVGKEADLILFDDEYNIESVFVSGEEIY